MIKKTLESGLFLEKKTLSKYLGRPSSISIMTHKIHQINFFSEKICCGFLVSIFRQNIRLYMSVITKKSS